MIHNFPIFVPAVHKRDDAISESLSFSFLFFPFVIIIMRNNFSLGKWFRNCVIALMDSRNKNGEIMNHNKNICRFHVNMQILEIIFTWFKFTSGLRKRCEMLVTQSFKWFRGGSFVILSNKSHLWDKKKVTNLVNPLRPPASRVKPEMFHSQSGMT